MSSTTIPANMLSADGKSVLIWFGSSTGYDGAGGKGWSVNIGGTNIVLDSPSGVAASWSGQAQVLRIDSDSVDVTVHGRNVANVSSHTTTRINGLDFTAAIAINSNATTSAGNTLTQTYFLVQALG